MYWWGGRLPCIQRHDICTASKSSPVRLFVCFSVVFLVGFWWSFGFLFFFFFFLIRLLRSMIVLSTIKTELNLGVPPEVNSSYVRGIKYERSKVGTKEEGEGEGVDEE